MGIAAFVLFSFAFVGLHGYLGWRRNVARAIADDRRRTYEQARVVVGDAVKRGRQ